MKSPLIFLILLFSLCGVNAQDVLGTEPDKLPVEAATLINVYDAEVAKIQSDAAKAIMAKTDAVRTKLQKAQENATKKGDLDGALLVKSAIDKLPKSVEVKPKSTIPLEKAAVGTWKCDAGYVITLTASKTATWGGNLNGGWDIDKSTTPKSIVIKWQNGCTYRISAVDGDTLTGAEENNDGTVIRPIQGERSK